jgi:hypothetical protein
MLISMTYQSKILFEFIKPSPYLFSEDSLSYLFTSMSVCGTTAYLIYEFVKRRANIKIYKKEN